MKKAWWQEAEERGVKIYDYPGWGKDPSPIDPQRFASVLGWTEGDYTFDGQRYKVESDGTVLGTMYGGWYPILLRSFEKRHVGKFGPPRPDGTAPFVFDEVPS